MLRPFLCALFVFASVGCSSLTDYTLTKRSAIDKEITAARAETESRLTALTNQQVGLLNQSIAAHKEREQAASNYLFKASVTFGTLKTPTRPEMVMGQSVQQTAAQLPPASPDVQAKTFRDLQTELDETRISTEALKAQYEKELGQARAEGAAKDKALTDLDTKLKDVDKERAAVLAKARQVEQDLQVAKDKVQDEQLVAKTKEANDAKALQALKTKASTVLGILAIICVAGAIYSPVFKGQFAIGSAAFGLMAVAVWYIEPWMVGTGVAVALLLALAWAAKNHYIESKAATATYQAIQSIKDTSKADYDRIVKPALAEWQTQYRKDGTVEPDPSIVTHIDQRLMEVNAK